jgi:phospholipase C
MLVVNKLSIITGVTFLCTACAPVPKSSIESCPYRAGQSMVETYPDMLRSTDIPIDHIIVVMQENRSFDHYFQKLPEYGQPDAGSPRRIHSTWIMMEKKYF